MQTVYFQNTLSGKKEVFTPIDPNQVKIYACGPTVYDFAHIGNFRSFLLSDLCVRVLKQAGYNVVKVQNITDVGHLTDDDLADSDGEDKILKKARTEKKDPFEIARAFENFYTSDEAALNILPPQSRPRATDFIAEQIDQIKKLVDAGFAYAINGSVYFRTQKFKDYGRLSKNNLADLNAGARVEVNSDKENPLDFALWKHAEPSHLMQWDSPWGKGFPGWHIECSAMSEALLGFPFDIHTGGEDNIFPHHECEIAQNECLHGEKTVNYWLHAKHLLVDNKKMSKSKGNFYTVRDLMEKGWSGPEIRFSLMSSHYRSALNFTDSSLTQARSSIKRIQEAWTIFNASHSSDTNTVEWLEALKTQYQAALFDDLNVAPALGIVFEIINIGFQKRDKQQLTPEEASAITNFLQTDFNNIFAVIKTDKSDIPDSVRKLLNQRAEARVNKDWQQSDVIREQIKTLGFQVLDESDGQRVVQI